ncbi:hypothetical protein TNCV_3086831 [Trichonephila clavipes]|nr:hypothetical protein TNCV_3086831 [Trichonephila clavipes]
MFYRLPKFRALDHDRLRILAMLNNRQVDNDNMGTVPIIADEDNMEFVQRSKSIIDADSDDENEINNTAHVPSSSEMRNSIKSMRS